jgi:hypothetical protein
MFKREYKRTASKRVKGEPTVLHDSSANNAQDVRITSIEQKQTKEALHRRKRNGSDGADQERGSNH